VCVFCYTRFRLVVFKRYSITSGRAKRGPEGGHGNREPPPGRHSGRASEARESRNPANAGL
jgi:hypothetical protein